MKTKRIDPPEVRIGSRILCSDRRAREVDVIHFVGDGVYRFWFTDDRWIEFRPGHKATVVQ